MVSDDDAGRIAAILLNDPFFDSSKPATGPSPLLLKQTPLRGPERRRRYSEGAAT
jgi:hypothetical protein